MTSREIINIGTSANDGSGDPIRNAFSKINTNFEYVFNNLPADSNIGFTGSTITSTVANSSITMNPNGTGTFFVNSGAWINSGQRSSNTTISTTGVIPMIHVDSVRNKVGINTNSLSSSSNTLTVVGNTYVSGNMYGNIVGNLIGNVIGDTYATGTIYSDRIVSTLYGNIINEYTKLTGSLDLSKDLVVGGRLTSIGRIYGSMTGALIGDVVGNVTGDVNGNVNGSLTGTVSGTLNGTVNGTLNGGVNGTLTGNIIGDSKVTGSVDIGKNLTIGGNIVGDLNTINGDITTDAGILHLGNRKTPTQAINNVFIHFSEANISGIEYKFGITTVGLDYYDPNNYKIVLGTDVPISAPNIYSNELIVGNVSTFSGLFAQPRGAEGSIIGSYSQSFSDPDFTIYTPGKGRTFIVSNVVLQQRTVSSSVGSIGDLPGMITVDGSNVYVCTGTYDGSTAIWKYASLTSF